MGVLALQLVPMNNCLAFMVLSILQFYELSRDTYGMSRDTYATCTFSLVNYNSQH